jgi:hypothetical protein
MTSGGLGSQAAPKTGHQHPGRPAVVRLGPSNLHFRGEVMTFGLTDANTVKFRIPSQLKREPAKHHISHRDHASHKNGKTSPAIAKLRAPRSIRCIPQAFARDSFAAAHAQT